MKAPSQGKNALFLSLLALGLATGCNAGSNNGGTRAAGSTVAPSTSNTSPISSTTAPITSAAPAAPVSATLALNHFAAFREQASVADLVAPEHAALKNKVYAVEDRGFVRVIDVALAKPALDRALQLDAKGALPSGISAGALAIPDDRTALVAVSGSGGEAVYNFDPMTAQLPTDVTKYDLSTMQVNFTTPQKNSKGVAVASPMSCTFTASATVSGKKLFIASSNFDANYDLNPGTIVAFDYDTITRKLGAGALMVTSGFNPTRLSTWRAGNQEALLCVNAGLSGKNGSSIDVIDPTRAVIVASIPIPAGNAAGAVAVTADGKRGFVGSQSGAEVYELDLSNLGTLLANTTAASQPSRYVGKIALPGTTGLNYVSGVALAQSGRYLYATNFNASSIAIVDLQQGPGKMALAGSQKGFQRSGDPTKFEGNAGVLGVRPGIPGTDFQGPSAYVITISLAAADRTVSKDVSCALDGVTFSKN